MRILPVTPASSAILLLLASSAFPSPVASASGAAARSASALLVSPSSSSRLFRRPSSSSPSSSSSAAAAAVRPYFVTSTKMSASSSSSDAAASSASAAKAKAALLSCPTIPLRDGTPHPSISFGTYKVGYVPASASSAVAASSGGGPAETVQRTAEECVLDALDVGYRSLECAQFYGNEAEVGRAIAESGIPREELFLCSKVWTTAIEEGPQAVRDQLDKTLSDLGTEYLDLYLIHWPVPGRHVEAYKTLVELKGEGKVRNIGVSNYAVEDYKELKEDGGLTGADLPAVNQIEINPFLYRKNTIDYFRGEGVVLQSYRSLRDGRAFDHPTLKKIAGAHDKTSAQILGRWCVQRGFAYTPKSVRKERMIENALVFDFELTDEEMEELDGLTEEGAYETFRGLYRKCVNRDTSKDGTLEGVKMDITVD